LRGSSCLYVEGAACAKWICVRRGNSALTTGRGVARDSASVPLRGILNRHLWQYRERRRRPLMLQKLGDAPRSAKAALTTTLRRRWVLPNVAAGDGPDRACAQDLADESPLRARAATTLTLRTTTHLPFLSEIRISALTVALFDVSQFEGAASEKPWGNRRCPNYRDSYKDACCICATIGSSA
jgi:hypothetical protein